MPTELTELALPPFGELEARVQGLSADDLATFRARARPHPADPVRDPLMLTEPRRRDVPTILLCCSFPATTVAELAAAGHPMFATVAELRNVTYVDLPTVSGRCGAGRRTSPRRCSPLSTGAALG